MTRGYTCSYKLYVNANITYIAMGKVTDTVPPFKPQLYTQYRTRHFLCIHDISQKTYHYYYNILQTLACLRNIKCRIDFDLKWSISTFYYYCTGNKYILNPILNIQCFFSNGSLAKRSEDELIRLQVGPRKVTAFNEKSLYISLIFHWSCEESVILCACRRRLSLLTGLFLQHGCFGSSLSDVHSSPGARAKMRLELSTV